MDAGTAFGRGCRVLLGDGAAQRQFWALIDVGHLPRTAPSEADHVMEWLPKCALVLAVAVLGRNQPVPANGIFSVAAPDYSKDPQREDAHVFRRRCRFDVLTVLASCINSNPPEISCTYARLETANTHTRIYGRDDFYDAIQFWQKKGYVTLLNRAFLMKIDQTHDDDMMTELAGYSWDESLPASATNGTNQPGSATMPAEYDVFVSHASEDKPAVVVPLTDELVRLGLRVWVDYKELQLGDKLRQRIDEGLSRSRFGVVIVSPRFFAKQWPQTELDGLVALELADGKKRILPVWHEIEYQDVAKQSPSLAARLAVKWAEGLGRVAADIMGVVRS